MSSTSEALVQLAEQKEALRQIANRYLDSTDRLAVDCTLQDIIDVFNEYDEYSYMNAFLNSIEVFPDKDYSIADVEGHITGIRDYALYRNSALKSVELDGITRIPFASFYREVSNLERVMMAKLTECSYDYFFNTCGNIKTVLLPKLQVYASNYSFWNSYANLKNILIGGICTINYANTAYFNNAMNSLIFTNQNEISLISNTRFCTDVNGAVNAYVYVPLALLSTYQTATNWVTIYQGKTDGQGNYNGIQAIEPNINDLRESGVDFSYTPYANKKWENNELVTDSTIGEVTE